MPEERKEQFTPGPWDLHLFGNKTLVVSGPYRRDICEIHAKVNFTEQCANTLLICAAPEMYEILNKMVAGCYQDHPQDLRIDAENVLKKVRGEADNA